MKKQTFDYRIIRSDRKSVALQIKPEGLIVRAPLRTSEARIRSIVDARVDWIAAHLARMDAAKAQAALQPITDEEIRALADRARQVIPARAAVYAAQLGVDYGRITIRCQRSRWGSCSSGGNLNFNCLLMLAPPEVMDSVVVHELCHRKEMNHSSRFYALVRKAFPEYDRWHGWLKEHGSELIKRLPSKE